MPALHYVPIVNDEDTPIPSYGVCVVSSIGTDGRAHVTKPTQDGQGNLLVNSFGAVPAGQSGKAHCVWPAIVAYQEYRGEHPEVGEVWGAKAGEWKLHKYYPGFHVIGGASANSRGLNLVNVLPEGMTIETAMVFVETGAVPDGDGLYAGVLHVFDTTSMSWVDTGIDVRLLNAN